ncbi:MAG: hypothetical protein HN948_02270 [Clostridia bacterium]|jgi:predicted DNA-binding transcriptional regulator YafY|nr:hypothetical protein [Clostridia bacterium]MBT7121816.1 hypothetical protein [Clostridia bacterium]
MKDLISKTLSVAVNSAQPVKIIYQGQDKITQRVIEVKSIHESHVVAYCRLRRRISTFKTESILAAQVVDEKKK